MTIDPKRRLLRRADTERETAYLRRQTNEADRRRMAFAERREITLAHVQFIEPLKHAIFVNCDICSRCGLTGQQIVEREAYQCEAVDA
jgi:hypothetical protein